MIVDVDSPRNPAVEEIRRLSRPRERRAAGLCLAEGLHLVAEAVSSGAEVVTLVVRRDFDGPLPPAARVIRASQRVLDAVATTRTPQPLLAVVRIPSARDGVATDLALAVDGLRDPGNLGTLLRVALAFGAGAVALGPGTADPWGPKALRAASGATFHRPPEQVADLAAWLAARPGSCWGLVPRGGVALDAVRFPAAEPVTLVVGSEAAGISPGVASHCHPLTIPMGGLAESLNAAVAGAVALYEAARQRGRRGPATT